MPGNEKVEVFSVTKDTELSYSENVLVNYTIKGITGNDLHNAGFLLVLLADNFNNLLKFSNF